MSKDLDAKDDQTTDMVTHEKDDKTTDMGYP